MDLFSFIDRARTVKDTRDGRMEAIEITLSDWVFNAINEKGKEILTISRDYFRLRKPLERRLYEIARKHCGQNPSWRFKVETPHERTGSNSSLPEFRRMIKAIIHDNKNFNHIPDYIFELENDVVTMKPRPEFLGRYEANKQPSSIDKISLKTQTYEIARKISEGWDVYFLEEEWRSMLIQKEDVPEKPDGSFIVSSWEG